MANANTGVEHGAESSGAAMPQLDPTTFSNQIFWLLVTLFVIYLILSRVALPRISAALTERSGTISNNIASAEEFKRKAAEAEDAYSHALADARTEAAKIVADAKSGIQQDLAAELAKADERIAEKTAEGEKEIAEIRKDALQSIEQIAIETASTLLTALGGKDDKAAITKAVAKQMKG